MAKTMFKNIDHIGIAVPDLDAAVKTYTTLLGKSPEHFEEVAEQKAKAAFLLSMTHTSNSSNPLLLTDPSVSILKKMEVVAAFIIFVCRLKTSKPLWKNTRNKASNSSTKNPAKALMGR